MKRTYAMVGMMALSVAVSFWFPYMFGFRPEESSLQGKLFIAAVIVVVFVIPILMLGTVFLAVLGPFGGGVKWTSRAALCVTGYLVAVLIFAAGYCMTQTFGDYRRAQRINNELSQNKRLREAKALTALGFDSLPKIIAEGDEELDFRGMKHRAFDSVIDFPVYGPSATLEDYEGRVTSDGRTWPSISSASSRRNLWLDCLHYSIVTAATVGYGDITPNTTFAKVITDVQILTSTAMLVFSFGFVLSGKGTGEAS